MKIFDWVTKKLQVGTGYSRVSHRSASSDVFVEQISEEKSLQTRSMVACEETDTESLLLHQALGSILAIGTLGHAHPLLLSTSQQQEPSKEDDKDIEEHYLGAATNAAVLVPPTAVEHLKKFKSCIELEVMNHGGAAKAMLEEEISIQPLLKEDRERKERGRTTLADLFAADPASSGSNVSGDSTNTNPSKPTSVEKTQDTSLTKHGKKPKHQKGENLTSAATASKKLHRLITRMLKKKIHPDLARREEELLDVKGGTLDAKVGDGGLLLTRGWSNGRSFSYDVV